MIFFFHSTKNAHFLDYLSSKIAQYLTDLIFADSLATKNLRVDKVLLHKVRVISMKIDFKVRIKSRILDIDNLNFVYWGRVHPVKNIEKSITLIQKLAVEYPSVKFTIIGNGNEKYIKNLKKIFKDMIKSGHLVFFNAVKHDKLPTLVSKEMFYLSTSEYEGFGMSIIEAMSLGLVPVIVARGEAINYCKYNLNCIDQEKIIQKLSTIDSKEYLRLSNNAKITATKYPSYESSFKSVILSIN